MATEKKIIERTESKIIISIGVFYKTILGGKSGYRKLHYDLKESIKSALSQQRQDIVEKIEKYIIKHTEGYPLQTPEEEVAREILDIIK